MSSLGRISPAAGRTRTAGWLRWALRAVLGAVLCTVMGWSGGAWAASSPLTFAVSFQKDRRLLSVQANEVPLQQVLAEIRSKTGVVIDTGETPPKQKITVRFQNLPLDRGLRLVLDGVSHFMRLNDKGQVDRVVLLAAEETGATGPGKALRGARRGFSRVPPPGSPLYRRPYVNAPAPAAASSAPLIIGPSSEEAKPATPATPGKPAAGGQAGAGNPPQMVVQPPDASHRMVVTPPAGREMRILPPGQSPTIIGPDSK
ncbi:MAG: hypothetical protein KQJ78_08915 [Deltaproteobacteria bacterium]|nr:hypothetical protein [Deltaproteobacteria bacterium]